MSMSNHESFEYQFRRLLLMEIAGENAEHSPLFADLLRNKAQVSDPLTTFLLEVNEGPEIAVLIRLLGKCFDDGKVPVLMRFLHSDYPELRRAAANALGWNRARPALEVLYQLEMEDPSEEVCEEARAAIDEILRDYPGLAGLVPKHEPLQESDDPAIPASHDEIPVGAADETQQLKLIAALPRLLAVRYSAIPLHFSPGDQLHIAVPHGMEKSLVSTLSELTGHHVQLHPWSPEKIRGEIERFYQLGDDDFCTFHDQLTPLARTEAVAAVLMGVNPAEPACPLDEANDAVEGVQALLAALVSTGAHEARVCFAPPNMEITARTNGGPPITMVPPASTQRERFLDALRVLSGLDMAHGLGRQTGGAIRCHHCSPPFSVAVTSEKTMELDVIHLTIAYG